MNTSQIRRTACLLTALLTLFFVTNISAQEFRGTIAGTITDPNGAVVPGAAVTVKNTETNVAASATSNDEGSYTIPLLLPGTYTVSATASGFKTSTVENVTVRVDDRLTIDVQLQVGAAAEVNIVANGDVIEQGSVTTGTLVTQRQIEELPLAEGAPYTLATQAPGIVYTGDPNFQGPTANGNLAGFRSNGTQGNQVNASGGNVINLDGSPNLAYDGQVAFTPPSEATQEFKVQTNTFDAQMGFTAGATVNVATKSGTNDFHGALYLYDRDKSRTANNFFNNRAGIDRPERKYNRYGATVSGPIFKNRTFFLFSYERQKDNVAQTTTYTVPTMLMRQGNFSELSYPIYDPATAVLLNTTCTPGSTGTTVCRTPFTGNIIPVGRQFTASRQFLQFFPEPNLPGFENNYITDQNLIRPYRSYMVRIDHDINEKNRIFGKVYHSRNTEDRYNLTMEPGSIFQGFENRRNNGGNVTWTSMLTSNLIFDLRSSFGMFKLRRFQEDQPTAGELGFTGLPSDRQDNIFPRFDFPGATGTNRMTVGSLRADYNDGRNRPFEMFTMQPTVTQIWGNHTLKYGYDFRRLHEQFDYQGYAAGRFQFRGTYTMQASNSSNTERDRPGRDYASFLLGIPIADSNSIIDNPQVYDVVSKYHGFFFHDDFRVNSKLTINMGLRYEIEPGYSEKEGRMIVDFDRTLESPIRAQAVLNYNANIPTGVPITAFQNLSGGFVFAQDSSSTNQSADKNNWQPRIGFSYAFDSKTVLRGGFGIFTAPFQIVSQSVLFQPGFSTPTVFTPTTNSGLTFIATLANPFPSGVAASPGSSRGAMTFVGRDLTSVGNNGPTTVILQNDRKNANYSRFIVGIQREVWGGVGLEATYVYSKGSDLAVNRELNYIPRECRRADTGNPCLIDLATANAATLLADITNYNSYLNASVPNPFRTLVPDGGTWNAATIQRRRLLTPFPQFGNVSITEYNGSSSFHSLQFQVVKRFTKGLSFNGSYTYSREHLKNQYLNPQDTELTEYISPNERPHRFTFSSIYELPVGKGRMFGNDWHPVADAIFGGWQIQGLYEWQSGEPLLFPNAYFGGDIDALKSKLGKKDGNGLRYGVDIPAWDTSGFLIGGSLPGVGNNFNSGNAVTLRNFPFTVDGIRNQRFLKFDVGVSKNFRIREGMKIQFRVDAINVLNRPYFSAPSVTTGFTTAPVRQPPRDIQIGGRFTF
ncbi:MAG TPA: carboxypeptidase regulatory-like domain-containing protein [Pyrinomonadaceae bacterium]|nr:carboxypeptidase regulatory-like domain-containing protein [Pyrinomonadaceae bacterium]